MTSPGQESRTQRDSERFRDVRDVPRVRMVPAERLWVFQRGSVGLHSSRKGWVAVQGQKMWYMGQGGMRHQVILVTVCTGCDK